MTGLSETMTPGNLSSLALSDAIAFRAEFRGALPPQALRYWRGPVMWDFDGRTWALGDYVLPRQPAPAEGSATYRYDVVLEPHNRTWLLALESAASVPPNARRTGDGQILARFPVRTRLRYDMTSVVAPLQGAEERQFLLGRALRLPPGFNPKASALAAEWRAAARDDAEVVARAIAFFKQGRFAYTLEPPLLGVDSVDEFLFTVKAGFCEHFSSAFVFLMRASGIPARVVTGYQGGEVNPVDRIVTVRQSDAHAWAEVYLPGKGWLRMDPTAAAVPGRVESGLARAVPQEEQLLLHRRELQWLRDLRHQWEAATHKWNVWVLGYNPERQRELMSRFGMRDADWRSLTATLFTALGVMTALLLLWSLRRFARPDPVQRAWRAFCAKLAATGVERSPHEGPRDFAERAARALPGARRPILHISALYISLRYGPHASARRAKQLRRLVRAFRLS
jgi:transglutaminase-like putative cysteine protease